MPAPEHITLFAMDCGATNWRLYRSDYRSDGSGVRMIGEPQPAPLTSFIDRRLPAAICLDPAGKRLESFGEVAQQQLDDESQRERVREHFKPCIGAHLEAHPLPHQKRYTHAQALEYTRLLLQAVLEQVRQEKLRSADFDDRVLFSIAYPVHWRRDHDGQVFDEFSNMVRGCFPDCYGGVRFVAEPEGAILHLGRRGLLGEAQGDLITLIFDIGGSTTDIVAGRVDNRSKRLEFLGRYGEAFGGGLYDAELAKTIADELKVPASALADDPPALMSLRTSAQRLKESLSRQLLHGAQLNHVPQRTVTLVTQDGSIFRRVVSLTEARFRAITSGLEAHFNSLLENALTTMDIPVEQVGQVYLVGGGAQLFTIIQALRQHFGEERVLLADNPEEIVVQGLGLEYGMVMEKIEPTILFPARAAEEAEASPAQSASNGWRLLFGEAEKLALAQGVTRVGRGEENDLRPEDSKVSRQHAELHLNDDELEVIDLGSTNGTFVNGERLPPNQPRKLKPGDEIYFGKTRYLCESCSL